MFSLLDLSLGTLVDFKYYYFYIIFINLILKTFLIYKFVFQINFLG